MEVLKEKSSKRERIQNALIKREGGLEKENELVREFWVKVPEDIYSRGARLSDYKGRYSVMPSS
ncbi:uncharacterized protein G2W53_004246 [Senna tora]|uniref:Uncharacterized protein n=1 Tax=Senna tora TaxID=362788 RepID=A0A834XET9_9FABA|nr:uncharacterized protein G2W53_004246 [Senna tora]